jgi:hypothetical protein
MVMSSKEIGAKKLKKLLALEPMELFQSGAQSCQDEKYSECFVAFAIGTSRYPGVVEVRECIQRV